MAGNGGEGAAAGEREPWGAGLGRRGRHGGALHDLFRCRVEAVGVAGAGSGLGLIAPAVPWPE